MKIELIGQAGAGAAKVPRFADVPHEHAIRGFSGVTMLQQDARKTGAVLAMLGFSKVAEEGNRLRFSTESDAPGQRVDVVVDPMVSRSRMGAGTVHHIAFRAADDEAQREWLEVIGKELHPSPVMDRDYFRSIYFREPGGVLLELATDTPGFATDEPIESLGEELKVPRWLEPQRGRIEKRLAPVVLHKAQKEVLA
jgi:glyoxalase family protein